MKSTSRWPWALVITVSVLWCVASLSDKPIAAAPRESVVSMANAAAQREDMIRELQEIKSLLREQNDLLRIGKTGAMIGQATSK